jgi:hypothetical protein
MFVVLLTWDQYSLWSQQDYDVAIHLIICNRGIGVYYFLQMVAHNVHVYYVNYGGMVIHNGFFSLVV